MRDPFSWSLPLGRLFGITVRMHVLFPLVVIGLLLRASFQKDAPPGAFVETALFLLVLFISVLLHEFGHCFGARAVEGDATEVLLWPLGGLAAVELPNRPRAHFITAAAGPAVDVLICLVSLLILLWLPVSASSDAAADLDGSVKAVQRREAPPVEAASRLALRPLLNPFAHPFTLSNRPALVGVQRADGEVIEVYRFGVAPLLARFFWINWCLFLLNVVLPGFPLDGGRMLQASLWPWYGFRQATLYAIFAGFVVVLVLGIASIVVNDVLPLFLALFVYVTCRQQWIILETGGEESIFGYDFSQGYTSLESGQSGPRRRRPNALQRWLQRRAARKMQQEMEQREAEERRMDMLLEKVQREGLVALTEEERRFLKRVSDRYRNRQ